MSQNSLLDELLLRWEELAALGQEPSAEELCRHCPDFAATLQRRIGVMRRWNAARQSSGARTPRRRAGPAETIPTVPGYEIEGVLGKGGMGVVYLARQVGLNRLVALKMILAGAQASPVERQRFQAEAEVIARLQHPHIVAVFEVGCHDGLPFFSMELCPGGSLAERLRGTPTDPDEAARLVRALAGAVQMAHQAGVVHRDLKPANVLLSSPSPPRPPLPPSGERGEQERSGSPSPPWWERGLGGEGARWERGLGGEGGVVPKVADFGLARCLDGPQRTLSGALLGTPSYMAPEQARDAGKEVGPAADIYSLGAILYECLTGRPPFKAATALDTVQQVLHNEPVPPRQLNARVPRDLETVCLKCLNKAPASRYASAADLADELGRFLANEPIQARPVGPVERGWRWCRRNRAVAALSAALLLFLTASAAGGVGMALRLNQALGQARQDRDRAREAELHGKRKLFESYLSEANATRLSGRPGQRFEALARIRAALEVAREVGLTEEDRLRLRNVALAALCLPDMEPCAEWSPGEDVGALENLDPAIRGRFRAFRALARLPAPAFELHGHSWHSADGLFVAVGTRLPYGDRDVPVRLWRVDGQTPALLLEQDLGPFEEATAFRPDGAQVAFGHADGSVSLHDLATGRRTGRLGPQRGVTFCLAYHPRLPQLAAANDTVVTIWDVEKGTALRQLAHPAPVRALAWHPAGHRLATACSGVEPHLIHLWDVEAARPITPPWQGHKHGGVRVGFDPSGTRLVSNDWGNVLRLWDATTGRPLFSRTDTPMLLFDSSGSLLGPGRTERRWRVLRVAGGHELRTITRPTPAGAEPLRGFRLHPDGRLLAFVTTAGLGFLDLEVDEEVGFVAGSFSRHLLFDNTGALWTAGRDGLLRWPIRRQGGPVPCVQVGPPERVAGVQQDGNDGFAISADGQVAAVPCYGEGALLVHRGARSRTLRLGPQYDVRRVWLSADGRRIVTQSHHLPDLGPRVVRACLWEAATGQLLAQLPADDVREVLGFSADGRWLLFVGKKEQGRLEVDSLQEWPAGPVSPDRPLWQKNWRSEPVRSRPSALSPDNRLAAFGSAAGIRLEEVRTNAPVGQLPSPEAGRVFPSCFSPDGALLLAGGEETGALYVYDLRRLRAGLAELGLDWDQPALPPEAPAKHPAGPMRLAVLTAKSAASGRGGTTAP